VTCLFNMQGLFRFIGQKILAADEVIKMYREGGKAEVDELEGKRSEENQIQGEKQNEGKKGVPDTFEQPFFFPCGGFFDKDDCEYTMNEHEHACTEEMSLNCIRKSKYPIAFAFCNDHPQTDQEKEKDQKAENPVSQSFLFLVSRQYLDQITTHHQQEYGGQDDGNQGCSKTEGLVGEGRKNFGFKDI